MGLEKNVWRAKQTHECGEMLCCEKNTNEKTTRATKCIIHRVDGRRVDREGGYGWGQEGPTNLLTTATRHGRPPILALAFIFICLCPPGSKTAQDVSLTPVIGAKHRRSRADTQHPKRGGGLTMVAKGWVAISNGWGVVCDLRLPKENKRLLPANE